MFSIWNETWCHTLTEMWACGLPVMAFDFPTVAARINATGAGWVWPMETKQALYQRILGIRWPYNGQPQVSAKDALGVGGAEVSGL